MGGKTTSIILYQLSFTEIPSVHTERRYKSIKPLTNFCNASITFCSAQSTRATPGEAASAPAAWCPVTRPSHRHPEAGERVAARYGAALTLQEILHHVDGPAGDGHDSDRGCLHRAPEKTAPARTLNIKPTATYRAKMTIIAVISQTGPEKLHI